MVRDLRHWTEESVLGAGRNLGPDKGVLGCRPRKRGGYSGIRLGTRTGVEWGEDLC